MLALTPEEDLVDRLRNLYLHPDPGVLDIPGEVAGIGDFDAVTNESVPVRLSFRECQTLSPDAWIESKSCMGREHDLIALRQLRAIRERKQNAPS